MKKLLTKLFLLTSVLIYSQDVRLDFDYSITNPTVGDTITINIKTVDVNSSTPSLIQFDLQYNTQLVTKINNTFTVLTNNTNSTAQTALSEFTGYKWSDGNGNQANLSALYTGWNSNSIGYSANNSYNVERVTIQDGQDIVHGDVYQIKFKIKDRASAGLASYSDIVELNWARMVDNSDNTNYTVTTVADNIDLTNVAGVNAGTVTINVNSPHSNKDQMKYDIYDSTQLENNVPKTGESPLLTGTFDSNGQFQSTALSLDATYYIEIEAADGGSGWMNSIVTVTDAYKAFQYAIATNINGGSTAIFEYVLQKMLGDVNNDGSNDINDSYEFLAHINGYESSAAIPTATGTADYHYAGLIADFGVAANNYETKLFTVTESVKTFNFGHAFKGDLDFSHSTEPTATAAKQDNFTVSSITNPNTGQNMIISNASTPDENYTLDISSAIVDGKVELTVNLNTTGLVGSQFNIVFDNTILSFDSIKYDTGNEMTDFSRVQDNKIWIGSLDYNGQKEIKTGTPYIVTFNMIQTVQNTAGLINYTVTEGVKANGTKVNFNIQ